MRASNFQTLRIVLTAIVLFIFSSMMISCNEDESPDNKAYTLSGNASGSQVVPGVPGTGVGTMSGTYNPQTGVLTYSSTWTGLTGAPNAGGFYNAAAGTNGTAVGDPFTIAGGAYTSGSANGTMTLTDEQANQLISGNWYYTYKTVAYPDGEVRGQVTATR